jgi:hypothetical protein
MIRFKLLFILILLSLTHASAQNYSMGFGASVNNKSYGIILDYGTINRNNVMYKIQYCRGIAKPNINDTYSLNTISFGVGQKSRTAYMMVYAGLSQNKAYNRNNTYTNQIRFSLSGDFGLMMNRSSSLGMYISTNNGVGIKSCFYLGRYRRR